MPDSEVKVPAASAEKAKEKAEPSSVKLPDGFAPEKISKRQSRRRRASAERKKQYASHAAPHGACYCRAHAHTRTGG